MPATLLLPLSDRSALIHYLQTSPPGVQVPGCLRVAVGEAVQLNLSFGAEHQTVQLQGVVRSKRDIGSPGKPAGVLVELLPPEAPRLEALLPAAPRADGAAGRRTLLKELRALVSTLLTVRPILRRAYGRAWWVALVRSALASGRLMKGTRWAGRDDPEARYVKSLAVLLALCRDMRRLGAKATPTLRELVTELVDQENWRVARESGYLEIADCQERWHRYFDLGLVRGVGTFNTNECVSLDPDRLHARVFRCVFHELAQDAGLPELGQMVCELDAPFHERVFPTHAFHRHGSPRNTLAFGADRCEYVWERRPGSAGT